MNSSTGENNVFFGGGERKYGILSELLLEHIEDVPSGGSIDWATYYFRDRRLAEALVRAHRRGVKVRVCIDGRPRTEHANNKVISILEGRGGIGSGFRKVMPIGRFFRLHIKLFCFSHPYPHAFVGSFNPSGDEPEEEPEILRHIGDQYRGFNVLVSLREPYIVKKLQEHVRWIHRREKRWWLPLALHQNRSISCRDMELFYLPRILPSPLYRFLKAIDRNAHCRIAASHIKGRFPADMLIDLAKRGCKVEVLAEPTERRVPACVEERLKQAGVEIGRTGTENRMPMHDKFMLIFQREKKWVIFGSFNWTSKSMFRNQEIGIISSRRDLYDIFEQRWEELKYSVTTEGNL